MSHRMTVFLILIHRQKRVVVILMHFFLLSAKFVSFVSTISNLRATPNLFENCLSRQKVCMD